MERIRNVLSIMAVIVLCLFGASILLPFFFGMVTSIVGMPFGIIVLTLIMIRVLKI